MNPKLPANFDADKLDYICDCLGIKTSAGRVFLERMLENVVLFEGKQMDYGPRNISSFGTFGVVVRMNDKFERIKSLFNKGRRRRAVNESIRDSFRDISNYAMIAYMLEMREWPESEPNVDKPT
jgi:hypothetical protein